jgi:cytochrome c oxidase subunit III
MATPEIHPPLEPRLAIQFDTIAKQEHALRFGMWLFLGSEVLLFGGLFALYVAYRSQYPAAFADGVHHNALALGTLNTVILIASSFTVAWSIHALRQGRPRQTLLMLGLTMLAGALFLVFKGVEYAGHFAHGIYPGQAYAFAEMPEPGAQIFFTLYFFMTGLHAIHMIAGLGVMAWLALRVRAGRTNRAYHAELECGALYWHLVDSIWIFLWPLFYLTG